MSLPITPNSTVSPLGGVVSVTPPRFQAQVAFSTQRPEVVYNNTTRIERYHELAGQFTMTETSRLVKY